MTHVGKRNQRAFDEAVAIWLPWVLGVLMIAWCAGALTGLLGRC